MNYTIFCGAEGNEIFWYSTYYELKHWNIYNLNLFISRTSSMGYVTDFTT